MGTSDQEGEEGPKLLSVVVPVYNEEPTLEDCLERVLEVELPEGMALEVVAVDDGSVDASREILARLAAAEPRLRVFEHERNQGKGAALRTGFAEARGDFVLIQDADLEYDPADYPILLKPLLDGRADVVYGSRFIGGTARAHLYLHYLGNKVLTTCSNVFTNLNLTDMETCYKVFTKEVASRLDLKSKSFTVEPEITAKVARMKARIFEVPISYAGRDYAEGKKIGWRDAFKAVGAILRFNVWDRKVTPLPERPRRTTRSRRRAASS